MVSTASMSMNVMTLSVVTTAPIVPTVSAIILTAATIAHAVTDTTQPTMPTRSVLIDKCADGTHKLIPR